MQLHTKQLVLRAPLSEDEEILLLFYKKNPHFTSSNNLKDWLSAISKGDSFHLLLFQDHLLIGAIHLTQIYRGPFQAAYLGFELDQAHEGRGLMHEALEIALPYFFKTLNLHRIMANYMPTNDRSGSLLEKLGFTVEGYARDYLLINGKWEDHVLTSLVCSG